MEATIESNPDVGVWLSQLSRDRGDWLLQCAYLLTRNQESAKDLVQETLMQAWRARDKLARADDPTRYLLRIMLNKFRSAARRRSWSTASLEELSGAATDGHEERDDLRAVSGAISSLSARQRAVIVMRYWLDYDDREIAELLACRPSTVRSLARRGLAAIRENLGENDHDDD